MTQRCAGPVGLACLLLLLAVVAAPAAPPKLAEAVGLLTRYDRGSGLITLAHGNHASLFRLGPSADVWLGSRPGTLPELAVDQTVHLVYDWSGPAPYRVVVVHDTEAWGLLQTLLQLVREDYRPVQVVPHA
jgi:hypothetical protein